MYQLDVFMTQAVNSLTGAAALDMVMVWVSAAVWPNVGLGAAYAGTTLALAVLLAAGAAEAATKLLTVQASARGLPWIAVRSELTRWVVLVAGWSAPLPPGLVPKCLVWVAASWAAALVFAWYTCSKTAPNGPMP